MLRIAVAGRPNTGKSSLFNRLVGKRIAIVEDTPGVTRDWLAAPITLGGHRLELVDTAGLESLNKKRGVDTLTRKIIQHNLRACQEADLIWMVVDASVALTPEDKDLARQLRRLGVPILAVANKAERGVVALGAEEAEATLGFGAPLRVSATHGEGLDDLAEQSLERLGLSVLAELHEQEPETIQGAQGAMGAIRGAEGATGASQGTQGAQSAQEGLQGTQSAQGAQEGLKGSQGATGATQGLQEAQKGLQATQGSKGALQATQGALEAQESEQVPHGAQEGLKGSQGATGATQGLQEAQKGLQATQGSKGALQATQGALEAQESEQVPHGAQEGLKGSQKPYKPLEAHKAQGGADTSQESEGEGIAPLLNLAVVGRPNVGKSTLVNALLGSNRLLVSDEAGTTRDAIAVSLETEAGQLRVTDTAGLRRSAKVTGRMEYLSRLRSREALDHAEQVWLVVDGTAALSKQDLRIATQTMEEGRALLIVVNRTDLTASREAARLAVLERLQRSLSQAQGITVVAISAKTGHGLQELLEQANALHQRWTKRISTGLLNRWLARAVAAHTPPVSMGRRIRIKYVTQYKARPPSFSLFTSQSNSKGQKLPASYLRYLEKDLRATFSLEGVPIRLHLKTADNPYQDRRKKAHKKG